MRTKEQIKFIFDEAQDCIDILEKSTKMRKDREYFMALNKLYGIQNFLIMCNEYEEDGVFISISEFSKRIEKVKTMHTLNKNEFLKRDNPNIEYYKGLLRGLELIKDIFLLENS